MYPFIDGVVLEETFRLEFYFLTNVMFELNSLGHLVKHFCNKNPPDVFDNTDNTITKYIPKKVSIPSHFFCKDF